MQAATTEMIELVEHNAEYIQQHVLNCSRIDAHLAPYPHLNLWSVWIRRITKGQQVPIYFEWVSGIWCACAVTHCNCRCPVSTSDDKVNDVMKSKRVGRRSSSRYTIAHKIEGSASTVNGISCWSVVRTCTCVHVDDGILSAVMVLHFTLLLSCIVRERCTHHCLLLTSMRSSRACKDVKWKMEFQLTYFNVVRPLFQSRQRSNWASAAETTKKVRTSQQK